MVFNNMALPGSGRSVNPSRRTRKEIKGTGGDMQKKIIKAQEFLRSKGILSKDHKKWIITFKDKREFDIVALLEEFANLSISNRVLPWGFPTHTTDVNGETICVGDTVGYDFSDSSKRENFIVVFENNCFRKKYKRWDKTLPYPFLEWGRQADTMRLIIRNKVPRI
jgi:hypothetical protein